MGRQAGKGFMFITGAKLYFLLTATFASLAFPRLFGDPVLFGQYRVVSGLLNVVTMVVITATVQAVSKLSSESGASLPTVRRSALTVQTMLFGPVFLAMFVFADRIAVYLLRDPALGTPLRVASLVVAAYSCYAVMVGLLNGTRRFGRQAALDVAFSTMKTGLMVVLVLVTGSVTWAFGGFATAAFIVLALSLFAVRTGPAEGGGRGDLKRRFLAYLLPLGGYALVLNLLLQADIIGIKASMGGGLGVLLGGRNVADEASFAAGIYGAAKNVATIPYQAVISLTLVVFPFVSRATSERDSEGAEETVTGAMRLAAVLSCMAVALLGAGGDGLLALLFGKSYAAGGAVLAPLLVAVTLMAMMFVGNALLASSGRPVHSLVCGVVAVAIQIGLLSSSLPGCSGAEEAWRAASIATVAGGAGGAAVSLALLKRAFPKSSWVYTVVLSGVGAAAAISVDAAVFGPLPWPVRSLLSCVVFMGILLAVRAVRMDDVKSVVGMLRRVR